MQTCAHSSPYETSFDRRTLTNLREQRSRSKAAVNAEMDPIPAIETDILGGSMVKRSTGNEGSESSYGETERSLSGSDSSVTGGQPGPNAGPGGGMEADDYDAEAPPAAADSEGDSPEPEPENKCQCDLGCAQDRVPGRSDEFPNHCADCQPLDRGVTRVVDEEGRSWTLMCGCQCAHGLAHAEALFYGGAGHLPLRGHCRPLWRNEATGRVRQVLPRDARAVPSSKFA